MLLSSIRSEKLCSVISGTDSSAESRHSHASAVSFLPQSYAFLCPNLPVPTTYSSWIFLLLSSCSYCPCLLQVKYQSSYPAKKHSPQTNLYSLFRVSPPKISSCKIIDLLYSVRISSNDTQGASSSMISTTKN